MQGLAGIGRCAKRSKSCTTRGRTGIFFLAAMQWATPYGMSERVEFSNQILKLQWGGGALPRGVELFFHECRIVVAALGLEGLIQAEE